MRTDTQKINCMGYRTGKKVTESVMLKGWPHPRLPCSISDAEGWCRNPGVDGKGVELGMQSFGTCDLL